LDDEPAPGILIRKRRSVAIIAAIAAHSRLTVEGERPSNLAIDRAIDVP